MHKFSLLITGFIFSLSGISAAQAQYPSFADLAEKLMPSVVNISTVTIPGDQETDGSAASEALGSGFIKIGRAHV